VDYSVTNVVPAVVKVVNVISGISHGAQKVAARAAKKAQPVLQQSAATWRRTVDDHIVPNVKVGLVIDNVKISKNLKKFKKILKI
jgi:hypothetical protein